MNWLDRVTLGQMALRLSREHLVNTNAIRHSDVTALFTADLMPNYQNPLVASIWQRCVIALNAG